MKINWFNKDRKGFTILLFIFVTIILLDLATTLSLGNLAQYLEINPLYKYVGFLGILLVNALFVIGIYYLYTYKKTSIFMRYVLIFCLVIACLFRLFVVYNNYQVNENPPLLEEAQQITQEQRDEYFQSFFFINIIKLLFPFIVGYLTFIFFNKDHVIQKRWQD